MIITSFKIALRNARKNGLLTFSKFFGVSISFAVILFATAYVYYETSFDKNVLDHNRIYRCFMYGIIDGSEESFAVTSPLLASAIVKDLPEVEEAVRINPGGMRTVYFMDNYLGEHQTLFADSNFFRFFGIPVSSNQKVPLETENSLAISRSLAETHFGTGNLALGKDLRIGGELFHISTVFEDFPSNFHLRADIIKSLKKLKPEQGSWTSQSFYTYFKTPGTAVDQDALDFKISKTVYTYHDEGIDGANAKSWDDLKYRNDLFIFYRAEPLTDVHFSQHKYNLAVTSNKTYVYGAIILSILVLIISSLNYVNLTIASLSTRLREMGVRKTLGAHKLHLTNQLVQESVFFWIVSFVLAIAIYSLTWEWLTQYLQLDFALASGTLAKVIGISFLVLLIFNLVTIIFPVLMIARKQVLRLIKGVIPNTGKFSSKSGFVFLQFSLSTLIILGSLIVSRQINFMVNKDRGYDGTNVIMTNIYNLPVEKRQSLAAELQTVASVKSVATSERYFGHDPGMTSAFFDSRNEDNYLHTSVLPVSQSFFNTFDIKLKEGELFKNDENSAGRVVVINETAAAKYSGEHNLVGTNLILDLDTFQIIGIVQDFNFRSLHHEIQPLALTSSNEGGNLFIKAQAGTTTEVLDLLQKKWQEYGISRPLDYEFHSGVLAEQYASDQQAKKLLLVLSLISIVIACVGLYAISYFIIIRKTKEIGIRKVNGASLPQILLMLVKGFNKLVLLAFLVATPLAWYLMDKWLQNFAYRTQLSWWIFAGAGFMIVLIAIITVSWQGWQAARRNPVDALRYE